MRLSRSPIVSRQHEGIFLRFSGSVLSLFTRSNSRLTWIWAFFVREITGAPIALEFFAGGLQVDESAVEALCECFP